MILCNYSFILSLNDSFTHNEITTHAFYLLPMSLDLTLTATDTSSQAASEAELDAFIGLKVGCSASC